PLLLSTHAPDPTPYTPSLHDALPISSPMMAPLSVWPGKSPESGPPAQPKSTAAQAKPVAASRDRFKSPSLPGAPAFACGHERDGDRKSTRLNSSHVSISYAVFRLKKK